MFDTICISGALELPPEEDRFTDIDEGSSCDEKDDDVPKEVRPAGTLRIS